MRAIRGRLLKAMEEEVTIRRAIPQRRSGDPEFTYPCSEDILVNVPVKVVILPYRGDAELDELIKVDYAYRCNVVPPCLAIRQDDQVVRTRPAEQRAIGKPEQILIVKQVTTVQNIQQLILQEKVASVL